MENIIITITNRTKTILYDIEVPTTLTMDKLKDDIVQALNGYNPTLFLTTPNVELFCNRLGRKIKLHETLETAGVWNGDYITIIEA